MIKAIIQPCVLSLVLVSTTLTYAQNDFPASTVKTFGDVVTHAEETAALHSKNTSPYHLKANIIETTNPNSEYRAGIEEFYQTEKNWRRTVTTPGLSWTQEMRDGHLQEQYSGDYAPFWLRNLLNGIADPLPQHKNLSVNRYGLSPANQGCG